MAHELIGDLESGANSFLDWNMLLDEQGGPNYVGNFCCAPFLYYADERGLQKQSVYDALWHFAHFIPGGSKRILSSSFSRDVEKTAFLRPDGSIVLVLLNRGGDCSLCLSLRGCVAELELPADALVTVEIRP